MACMKCGSAWTTLKGKDMVSCPECCKQQRCKARRLGRLPNCETKACERCGVAFIADGANAMARSRYCPACSEAARQEYVQARKAAIESGEWKAKPQVKGEARKCLRCEKKLCKNQIKYCGGACFHAAKKEGIQSWDRTGQLESVWHRGGRWACAPSRKPLQELRTSMLSFLARVNRMYELASRKPKPCEMCGEGCYGDKARFCSLSCLSKSESTVLCYKCGTPCIAKGVSRRKLCSGCKVLAVREARKREKREKGSYRKRCRKYGGHYNTEVSRRKVFERDNWRCHVCKRKTLKGWHDNHPREATVDHHPIPLSRGGDHDWHNVKCACRRCNSEKGNKWSGQRRLPLVCGTA